ncbi:MAG: MAF protein [Candidatus Azotimanducaceae bacterium]|jgi:MAF protein
MEKLGIRFDQVDPGFKERRVDSETPEATALRLAAGKAMTVSDRLASDATSATIVIGSDQVAHVGNQTIGSDPINDEALSKPGNFENAVKQLQRCSGQWVTYSTAVCLVRHDSSVLSHFCEHYRLKFRHLSDDLIRRYLALDQPYDCAGSIKAEAHGIMLIEDSDGQDINTVYGLPLIRLITELSAAGVVIPSVAPQK